MLERLENGNLKQSGSMSLSPDVASVKMGGEQNSAYAGVPQEDDVDVLKKDGEQDISVSAMPQIVSYLMGQWTRAVNDKNSNLVDEDLVECLLQFKGEYTNADRANLSARGLPLVYFPLSEHKVHTAIAWIDEFFTNGETLINIRPTPIPEMETDVIKETFIKSMNDIASVIEQTGQMPSEEQMFKYSSLMRQIVEQNFDNDAKEKALKMERKIRDDLVEGNWSDNIHELVSLCCTYGTAALRCPVIKIKHKLSWKNGKATRERRVFRTFEAISPFDLFPSPGAKNAQEGDFIVRVRYSSDDLQKMRGNPFWIDDAINDSLSHFGVSGLSLDVSSDSVRRDLESQRATECKKGLVEGFEYWGGVSGEMLAGIGITEDARNNKIKATAYDWYQINAILIGNNLVYCRVMEDGEDRPIEIVKFYDTPGSFWGRGVLQIIRSLQRICNAAGRSLVTNMGYASGPQGVVDLSMIDSRDDLKMRPFKLWAARRNASNLNSGKPVEFFNVDSHSKELISVFDYHQRLADELTGIPAFANGTDAATGASRTASGLNLLMGQANRGIKKVVGNFDELVRHSVRRLVEWHMLHDEDKSAMGDVCVEVTGLRYFVTKTSRANDILNLVDRITQNPELKGIPGADRLCSLLHEVGIAMDLGAYSLAPSTDELKRRQEEQRQAMLAQQQQMAAQQAAQMANEVDAQVAVEQAKAAGAPQGGGQ